MDHSRTAQLIRKLMLHLIDHLMQLGKTSVHRHLRMQGKHDTPRSVIMYHQIMHSKDLLV